VHPITARLDEAREELERALAMSRAARDTVREAFILFILGYLQNWTGAFREDAGIEAAAVDLCRRHNLIVPLLRCLWSHALMLTGIGDYDRAWGLLEEGRALAEKIGDESTAPRYLNTLGWLASECEDHDAAIEFSVHGAERVRIRHPVGVEMRAYALINHGDAAMAKGVLALAHNLFDEAHGIATNARTSDWMKWRYSMHLFVSLAELARLAFVRPMSACAGTAMPPNMATTLARCLHQRIRMRSIFVLLSREPLI
jgi:tetratricopeptide (TPR) repeat protein